MYLTKSVRVAHRIVASRRGHVRSSHGSWSSGTIWLEERILLTGSLTNPVPIAIGAPVSGNLSQGGTDFYQIQSDSGGRLIAQTYNVPNGLELRLSVYDSQANLLVESDGQSSGRLNPLIDQHVSAGAEILEVQGLSGSGAYSLSTSLTPASGPAQNLVLPTNFQGSSFAPIAVGDFTNNGFDDIVAPDGVHLANGDGTFQTPPADPPLVDPARGPSAIAVGDFNNDHKLDVALALANTDSISISLGNGDGTFKPASTIRLSVAGVPEAIVAGDFGNGQTDLAVTIAQTGGTSDDVIVLMGNGDGTFTPSSPIPVGKGPDSIALGNFGQNGHFLAVADINSGDVTILSSLGGGSFSATQTIVLPGTAPTSAPTSIVAGDFGNGSFDLAVTDSAANVVYILKGNGDGTFEPLPVASLVVGANPYSIVAGDFGNGHLDLAVADAGANDVSVLLGNGDLTFQAAIRSPTTSSSKLSASGAAGSFPVDIAAGNFNGDGRLDVATGNIRSSDITVLLGKGDGSFEAPPGSVVGSNAVAVATGDFTGNGNLGVAVLNQASDSVTILPGNGDGTFQQPLSVALPQGSRATSIVTADFNNDGRADLAVADPFIGEVSILLGNGDGTFQSSTIAVPGGPYAIAAGDFTGNGLVDLAVADQYSSSVTILLGKGDGTFTVGQTIALVNPADPTNPDPYFALDAIVAGNFTNSGHLDLAVAEPFIDAVTVLVGAGNGTFTQGSTISFGETIIAPSSMALVTGDFRNNGLTDLAVASSNFFPVYGDTVNVLLSNGDGTFQAPAAQSEISIGSGIYPTAIVAGYFTNNGVLDLATADANGGGTDDFSVFLGNGDGTFQPAVPYALGGAGASSTAIATGDFAGNGRTDLAITRAFPDSVEVRLSNGDGTFSSPSAVDLVRPETPLVADLNGDGAPDVSVVDAAGDILFRAGRPGEPGSFAPPVTVNPRDPSRAIAFVSTRFGPALASVDVNDDFISFFTLRSTGFVKVASMATGSQPAQILTADLGGTGVTDLIVRNAGDGTIWVFPGDGNGWFLSPRELPVGVGASDVEVADLAQDGRLDIVYTDRLSGEVGVLENLGNGFFAPPVLYRAGPGPYGVTGTASPSPVSSLEGTTTLAVGSFTTDGIPSLVALNPGSNTLGLLSGLGDGRLSNPTYIQTPTTGLVVRAIDFSGNGQNGLAVLSPEGLFIYRSDGQGGFLAPTVIDPGFEPNGLTVADLTGDGKADLLVSNPLGDVRVLIGNGDGSFQPVRNLDQQVSMAVYAQSGTAPAAFVFANQLTDQIVVQTVGGGITVLGSATSGLVTPGAVTLADLNNNGILDLIVANSGSNNVLVYTGTSAGTFDSTALNAGHGFFTGTNPVGITVADINGDGRLDLIVANRGSNDVSILFNEKVGNSFTFVPGPRLEGGVGPVATALADIKGNGHPDLLIADSSANQVLLLQGIGNGFFNDQNPIVFPVGTNPTALLVGQFTGGAGPDLVTVNSGSNNVTLISGLRTGDIQTQTVSSGGDNPTAAFSVALAGNGLDSLVVANNGNGNIALLQADEAGLSLASVLSAPGLPNPSALALSTFSNGEMEFYATNEGESSASLLGFQLEEGGGSASISVSSATGGGAQLLSLNETSLALIGSLLTLTLQTQNESQQSTEGAETAQVASAGPGAAGQSLVGQSPSSDQLDKADADSAGSRGDNSPAMPSWARFVTGVDQAIETLRQEADARLRQEQEPAKSQSKTPGPGASIPDKNDGPGQSETTTPLELAAIRRIEAQRDRFEAIDLAVSSWEEELPLRSQPLLPHISTTAMRKAPAPVAQIVETEVWPTPWRGLDTDNSQAGAVPASRLATLMAISATAMTAREILLGRASLHHRRRPMARTRNAAVTRD
jgi:FG-GAP-like repeat